MNPIYKQLLKNKNELAAKLEKYSTKLLKASLTAKGDIENEITNIEEKIQENEKKIKQYKIEHLEEFFTEPKTEKKIKEYKFPIITKKGHLRDNSLTQAILLTMTTNTWIHTIENQLSLESTHWSNIGTDLHQLSPMLCYTEWYCREQQLFYSNFANTLFDLSSKKALENQIILLNKRNKNLRLLVPCDRSFDLSRHLDGLISAVAKQESNLCFLNANDSKIVSIKTIIKIHIEKLCEELQLVRKESLNLVTAGGVQVENNQDIKVL